MKKHSRFILMLAVALFCIAAVAAAAPPAKPEVTANKFTRYTNADYGIRIDYPANWSVVENFMGSVVAFGAPLDSADDKFRENITILVQDLSASPGMTLAKYDEISLAQAPMTISDFKLIDRGDRRLAGAPAKTLIYTGRQGEERFKLMAVYTVVKGQAYYLTFTAAEADYARYEKLVLRIINSFALE